jgi:uncharacterized membrane protein YidH (DUF202 family)
MQQDVILKRGLRLGIVHTLGMMLIGGGLHWFMSGASQAHGPGRRLAVLVQIAVGLLLALGAAWRYRREERRLRQANA